MSKIIEVKDLTIYYGSNNRALENINVEIEEGDFLGIVGQNGSGKSTFLKSILGLIPITSGEVFIKGVKKYQDVTKIGYVCQHSQMNTEFPITVLEAVELSMMGRGLHPFKYLKKNDNKDKAMEVLKLLSIDHLSNRQLFELSGGEFQRLLIARALAIEPEILILDEPTASIDAVSREMIYNFLGTLKNKMTVILVSHDLEEVIRLSSKILALNNKVAYYGSSDLTVNDINQYWIK